MSSIKSTNIAESPKTPGGISKSLLTPCRRVGLSRNWRKGGSSPFISPLSSKSDDIIQEKYTRKRKNRENDVRQDENNTTNIEEIDETSVQKDNVNKTPHRNFELSRHKRSKTLLPVLTSETETHTNLRQKLKEENRVTIKDTLLKDNLVNIYPDIDKNMEVSSVHLDSESKKGASSSTLFNQDIVIESQFDENCVDHKKTFKQIQENKKDKKIPENLIKECTIVIQKNIFKKDIQKPAEVNSTSQTLFDSDSDDIPLCNLNKVDNSQNKIQTEVLKLKENDDFIETNTVSTKKVDNKKLSVGNLKKLKMKNKSKENIKICKTQKNIKQQDSTPSSQSSYNDDDDDFEVNNKRTILIKKTYDKISKPVKAKSTGSITQKDIDELRSRIKIKKKLLLTKAKTEDTAELRTLVKKWQKGCQDALIELMELMRKKFPDKPNMEYSEMLQMLKIPATLVGYDSDNDCFVTPDDSSIILSKFNDI
ncbi:uncharacterized protein LOC113514361 [Galleria mellonella]|uniref:Uncharacterized protein LOC113514361 n=1 Tax=Galleria mellonella TaxID=7137 RepID=A0A6J1WQC0_GALME|nr:uncharacterized protein LOC113514361 [Galleria mellonella]